MATKSYKDLAIDFANQKIQKKLIKKGKLPRDSNDVYVMYLRRSTEGEEQQVESIPTQYEKCLHYANIHNLNVVPTPIKEEKSAFQSGKRDFFNKMLDEIKKDGARKFNSILAYAPDRLARNMREGGELIDLLSNNTLNNIKFAAFEFNNDHNGLMNLGIHFVIAKLFSDNLSANTKKGIWGKTKDGKGQNLPKKGYRFSSDGERFFRPDGNNFELLQEAFHQIIRGKPLEFVANYLNESGFTYVNKKLERCYSMNKKQMGHICSDPFYCGILVTGETMAILDTIDLGFTPMLSYQEFIEMRKQIDSSEAFERKGVETIMFRDLVHCGHCNRLMTPGKTQGRTNRYLRLHCNNSHCERTYKRDPRTNQKIYTEDVRSKVIFDEIENVLGEGIIVDKKLYNKKIKELPNILNDNLKPLKIELSQIRKRISELTISIENKLDSIHKVTSDETIKEIDKLTSKDVYNKAELLTKQKELEAQINEIELNLEETPMSWEEFRDFFKYINGIIQNSENRYEVDNAIRTVFRNFVLKGKKVASYELQPDIEPYVKVKLVQSGVEDGI